MTMLKATTIHWHNRDEIPKDGEYLCAMESGGFQSLTVNEGHWNTSRLLSGEIYDKAEIGKERIKAWAELPNMED